MTHGRMTTVRLEGHTYSIPDIWLAGFCTSNSCSTQQAIEWWHSQSLMADNEQPYREATR